MARFIICILLSWSGSLWGQTYQMDGSLTLINDCGGFFTDSGGSSEDYANNENFLTTICKDPLQGTHIRVTLSQIDLALGDKLCFYDGLDTNADSLICIESYFNGVPLIVQATAANTSGCLTVTFNSNGNEVGNGWEANIDCIPACQLIQANIEQTEPASIPDERGWIDICQGERIFFDGAGAYPQNNLVYEHGDFNSTFEWDFGDGSFAVGKKVSHAYEKEGGYQVKLTITDQFGCTNGNFAFQKVRVATKPNFIIGDLPNIVCIGDSIRLSGSTSEDEINSTIEVATQEGKFLFNGIRSDSLPLPDGNGASYRTSIRFSDFEAGQVLTDINDLRSICLNMEHSWLHDMEIRITCPSGKSVLLQSQEVINKEVYLGIPVDNDGVNPESGQGKEYCWTPNSTNGTITEFANKEDDSSPNETYFLPAKDFNSFEDLEQLLGCPLNGDWVITVTDLWEQDNGWIFSWSMDINPDLYPDLEVFQPQIIDYQWQNNPDIINFSNDIVVAQPTSAGTTNYVFEATDNYGCQHDTALQITVLPNNHPDCLNCDDHLFLQDSATICLGSSLSLEQFIDPYILGVTDFVDFPNIEFSKTSNPPENALETTLEVSNIPNGEINQDGSNLIAVCLDLTSEFNSDLSITLVSPNGIHLNLSSENGGRNDGYLMTCFTNRATRSISDETTSPFMGDYLPEEPFSNFAGTDINGTWTLKLSDDAGASPSDVNVLKSWSMTFLSPDDAVFEWSPNTALSCTTCTNPTADPDETTSYILEKNFEGCSVLDTLTIKVIGSSGPENITDISLADGKLLVTWDPILGVSNYEISTNSVDWESANGFLSHIFDDLVQGTPFNVYVRGIYDNFSCATKIRSRAVVYKFCDVMASLGSRNLVTSCFDGMDAFIVINSSGGIGSHTYSINDSPSTFNNRFDNLAKGDYTILVEDGQACADTLSFTVVAPPPLNLSFDKNDLDCFGDDMGTATVLASGGVGGFRVENWSHTGSKETTMANLSSGLYFVTVADANDCLVIDTLEILEPTELQAIASASPVSCFGFEDGGATVKVTHGTPPYSFEWSNGQTGASAVNLDIGTYTVTVEDANNCKTERIISVTQPAAVNVSFQEEPISCPDATDGALLAIVNGGIPPYNYEWNTGQTNQFAFGLEANTYFLLVTDSKGCLKEEVIQIEAPNPLAISTSFTPPSCSNSANGTATVNVVGGSGNYAYLWNDSLAQQTPTAINLSAGLYEIMITDGEGCMLTQSVSVEKPTSITTSITTTPATCSNRADGTADLKVEGGTGNYTFLWDNGNISATNTGLLPGAYEVIIEDDNNCQLVDTITITAPTPIIVDSISQKMPLCNGAANGQLEAFLSGGTGPYTYTWDNNTQATANPYIGVSAGLHSLSILDANNCSILPVEVTLTDPPALNLSTTQTDVTCFADNSGLARVNVIGGAPPYSYQWNDPSAQTTESATNLLFGTYEVVVTDANGCNSDAMVTIDQPIAPITVNWTQTDTACFKEAKNQISFSTSGGTGINYTYEWNFGPQPNVVGDLSAGTYSISVYDENNCRNISIVEVVEYDSIAYSLIEVKPTCSDTEDGRLAISPITGGAGMGNMDNYQIQWSTNQGMDPEVIQNLKGNSSYQVTVTDQLGCQQVMDRYLEAPAPITLVLSKEDISCFESKDGQLSVNAQLSTADIAQYEWSQNIPNTTIENATNLDKGMYSLTITDIDGCTVSASETILEPLPVQITSSQIIPNVCSNESNGQIILSVEGGSNNFNFDWSDGSSAQNLINAKAGQYTVQIRDGNNCMLIDSFSLMDPDALQGSIQTQPISCFGDRDGQLQILPSGGIPPYAYSLDGNEFNGIGNVVGLPAGNYRAYIKDQNNCIWESELTRIDDPLPFEVNIQSDQTKIALGDSLELVLSFANNSGSIQYDWIANTPNTFNCMQNLCSSIMIKPPVNTSYEVYAIDEKGCEASDRLTILVSKTKDIFVPTGFSPNGDGTNDVLIIHGKEGIQIESFRLFDRWGEEVYYEKELTINNPKNAWDGTFKGDPLNSGLFVWLLEVRFEDGTLEVFKGNTTLIR